MAIRTRANPTPSAVLDKLLPSQTLGLGLNPSVSGLLTPQAGLLRGSTLKGLLNSPAKIQNQPGSAAAPIQQLPHTQLPSESDRKLVQGGDEYDQRIDALIGQQKTDLATWDSENLPHLNQLGSELAALKEQLQHAKDLAAVGASDWGQPPPDVAGLEAAIAAKQNDIDGITGERQAMVSEQNSLVGRVRATADALRQHASQQKDIDTGNQELADSYNALVDPYNASVDEYGNYLTAEGDWAQKAAALQADIDAGKYKVDPFAYLRSGNHTIPEINALREQINAGNLHPNMGVPELAPAPTVVQRPGDAPVAPQLRENAPDVNVAEDVGKVLGYTKPPPKQITLKQAKTVSDTPQPAPPPAPKANPEAKPTPVTNPGTVNQSTQPPPAPTTQQTPQQSPVTTQAVGGTTPAPPPAAPINPSASLPPQTSGSVAGQSSGSGASNSTKSEPVPTPAMMQQPTPFKDPDKVDPKDKDKWEL